MGRPTRPQLAERRRRVAAHRRRQDLFRDKFRRADTPSKRVSAAVDFLRSVLNDVSPTAADAAAREAVRVLVEAADRLAATPRRDCE